jgi:hypothetical protein
VFPTQCGTENVVPFGDATVALPQRSVLLETITAAIWKRLPIADWRGSGTALPEQEEQKDRKDELANNISLIRTGPRIRDGTLAF